MNADGKLGFSDPYERQQLLNELTTFYFPKTGFSFIDDHYGLRPGCMHVLMGTTGQGKSTLVRSLLLRAAEQGKRVWIYSSEESVKEINRSLSSSSVADSALEYVSVFHEDVVDEICNDDMSLFDLFKTQIEIKLASYQPDLIVVDNLTTSGWYDGAGFERATLMIAWWKKVLRKRNIPGIFVAHTKDGVGEGSGLFSASDIRGPKVFTNKTEFLYFFQMIYHTDPQGKLHKFPVIRIGKSRGYSNAGLVYKLNYSQQHMLYVGDQSIDHNKFNEIFNKRDTLKKK